MALLSKLSNKRSQGSIYEQKARVYLETQGLKFIAANQTFKCGELDLVMTDGDTIVFVEVRQRKSNRFGSAVESIDYRNIWLFTKRNQSLDTAKCRFDVVAFEGDNPPLWLPNFLG